MEVVSLAVGLMSLTLGGFAMWLSFQFYTKAKDAEKETTRALEGIRAQTDTLQGLAGRWMDRLTQYVTQPRQADEGMMALVTAMADLPTAILSHLELRAGTKPQAESPQHDPVLVADLICCYISLYYYTALANITAQHHLPSEKDFDANDETHSFIRQVVDTSAADFAYMEPIIRGVDQSWLNASQYKYLLEEATVLRPHVRDSAASFASHGEATEDSDGPP